MKLTKYNLQFYYDWKLKPNSSNYNILIDRKLSGLIDINRLKVALNNFVAESLIVNSHIELDLDGQPCWKPNLNINYLNYFPQCTNEQEIYNYAARPFNLECEPLYRFGLFELGVGQYRLVLIFHHIVIDVMSWGDIHLLISNYYNDPDYHQPLSLADQRDVYINYLETSNNSIENLYSNYDSFWLAKLDSYETINLDCFKYTVTGVAPELQGNIKELCFKVESIKRINQVCRIHVLTPYMFTMTIFAIMIHRYTGQDKFLIGYPLGVKGAPRPMVGGSVNLSVIPFRFYQGITVVELLKQCKEFITALKDNPAIPNYANYPLKNLIELFGNNKLISLLFGVSSLNPTGLKLDGIALEELRAPPNLNFPEKVILEQEQYGNSLNFRFRYDSAIYDSRILEQFIDQYLRLINLTLDDLITRNSKSISSYQLLDNALSMQSLVLGNNNIRKNKITANINELFEKQVLANQDKVAIVSEYGVYTYSELNQLANRIAYLLLNHYTIEADTLIVIVLAPSPIMIATILGILKAGAAYLPIDPEFSLEYLQDIIKLAKPITIISEERFYNKLARLDMDIRIEFFNAREFFEVVQSFPEINPTRFVDGSDLAYVLYSSGTTGKPKGIMVEHSAVVNFACNNSYLKLDSSSVVLQASNYAFDASIFEIFATLLNGGRLVLLDESTLIDYRKLAAVIKLEEVNTAWITAKLFLTYIGLGINNPLLEIKNILFGGEKANYVPIARFAEENRDINLIHGYGPTETTVFATTYLVDTSYNGLPIGKPIADKVCYVLDSSLNPLPAGAIGMLYIGGYGLARGYLNNEELTRERFIPCPFELDFSANQILYKTGDLVRYLPDGNIEYIARIDSQVKINGFLVNLDSIETVANKFSGISNSLAIFHDEKLILYYDGIESIDKNSLIQYLQTKLPAYMVPNCIIQYKFEFNSNGKINRHKLPDVEFVKSEIEEAKNDIERYLCQLFADVLNIDVTKVGRNSSFTSLGGNSLKVISLINKLTLKYPISLSDIYKYSSPKQLAGQIMINQSIL